MSLYTGTVTRVTAAGPFVKAPRVSPGAEFGPCLAVGAGDYAAGDKVLVDFLEGGRDELVILGPITSRYATDADLANETNWRVFTDNALDSRLTSVERADRFGGNLLPGPSFEEWGDPTAPAGWTAFWSGGTRTTSRDQAVYHRGSSSWRADLGADNAFTRHQTSDAFRVIPGAQYAARWRGRWDNLGGRFGATLQTNDDVNDPNFFATGAAGQDSPLLAPHAVNVFEEYAYAGFIVPPNHTRARLYITADGPDGASSTAWLDDVELRLVAPPTDWHPLAYANWWGDYGGGYAPPAVGVIGGTVHVQGLAKNGTGGSYVAAGITMATLPVGYRPRRGTLLRETLASSGVVRVDIGTDGNLILNTTTDGAWLSLDLSFPL